MSERGPVDRGESLHGKPRPQRATAFPGPQQPARRRFMHDNGLDSEILSPAHSPALASPGGEGVNGRRCERPGHDGDPQQAGVSPAPAPDLATWQRLCNLLDVDDLTHGSRVCERSVNSNWPHQGARSGGPRRRPCPHKSSRITQVCVKERLQSVLDVATHLFRPVDPSGPAQLAGANDRSTKIRARRARSNLVRFRARTIAGLGA